MPELVYWIVGAAILMAGAGLVLRNKLGPALPEQLRPGKTLPDFTAAHEHGDAVQSDDLRGRPATIPMATSSGTTERLKTGMTGTSPAAA